MASTMASLVKKLDAFAQKKTNEGRYKLKKSTVLTNVINSEIELISDKIFSSNEGCLSVTQIRDNVERHLQITVSYFDESASQVRQWGS